MNSIIFYMIVGYEERWTMKKKIGGRQWNEMKFRIFFSKINYILYIKVNKRANKPTTTTTKK